MTTQTLNAIAALALGLATQSASAQASTIPFAKIFMSACVAGYGHPQAVSDQARRLGLLEIEGEAADQYLAGHSGRAWRGKVDGGNYAVSVLADGSCSVFAHEGSAKALREAIESWLPPPNSGFVAVKERPSAGQGLESFRYVMRGGKVHEEWFLTVTDVDLPKPLRAIVTYRGL